MNVRFTDKGETVITAAELSSFAAKRVKGSLAYTTGGAVYVGGDFVTPLSYKIIKNGEVFIAEGSHDGIYTLSDHCAVEKIKRVKRVSRSSNPLSDSMFLAESFVVAFLTCKVKSLSGIVLRITLQGENGKKSFDFNVGLPYLSSVFDSLLSRAAPFASIIKKFAVCGRRDISAMPFPYPTIREGQRDFINEVYRTIKKGGRLLAAAPTGTGKTVSSLFPAVKALGEGYADKIFYLTAKTVTGKNALDAMRSINRHVPDLRAVSIVAKERCCPSKDPKNPFSADRCTPSCPRLCDGEGSDYTQRRCRALLELLGKKTVYESGDIKLTAEKYSLCPYELSLDLSEYCQVIVCDYNYVFDTRIRLRRYFSENRLKYIILADEAHNLPDRARDMYFARLTEGEFLRLADSIRTNMPYETELLADAENAVRSFAAIKELCRENTEADGDGAYGYFIDTKLPENFTNIFYKLSRGVKRAARNCDSEELSACFDRVLSDVFDLAHAEEFFDEHFVFFGETNEKDASFKLICLDPSKILDTLMKGAVSSVLFSATLTPLDYFADILGCESAATLELDSPYDTSNLCIAAVDTVSTKLSARDGTSARIAQLILSAVTAKQGNYLVYFPSYKYMKSVVKEFLSIAPRDIRAVMQKPDMSLASREKFLSFFREKRSETLVGFCVLGGIFSEGIDLPDEKLIGAVLVGIGLPGLSSELNILRDYFDKTREDGYNFAYVYPGMIKVLQAAGRVIRGENDRGVIVLIDERYKDPSVRKIFPSHWKNIRYVGNSYSLSKYLKSFWDEKQTDEKQTEEKN